MGRANSKATKPASGEGQPRRRRRTREDVEANLRKAALELFAERGFSATTTREIAACAKVSETLLFRYFGDKAQLFDAVVYAPFTKVMADFAREQEAADDTQGADPYLQIFDLLTDNRDLLRALVFGGPPPQNGSETTDLGFEPFLKSAIASIKQEHAEAGITDPGFDVDAGVRLAFGMMASAVLMREWLFPGGGGDRDHLVDVIETLVGRALISGAPKPAR
ncbi:TetR/AcrR family transcriptional regulator [Novosphingobium malaysiense]|uniref:TetR/AcrR family transcriptional regulator n=1 Tax=Novosphingobium malaysiense TaxID=1348853 RepID=UPI0006910064|nr:TetR/AcrR family transcriptional regulator [Novosphingobium malaysiense]